MFYSGLLCSYEFGCCGICTRGGATDTELTAPVGNIGTVGINNTRIAVRNEVSPRNERRPHPRWEPPPHRSVAGCRFLYSSRHTIRLLVYTLNVSTSSLRILVSSPEILNLSNGTHIHTGNLLVLLLLSPRIKDHDKFSTFMVDVGNAIVIRFSWSLSPLSVRALRSTLCSHKKTRHYLPLLLLQHDFSIEFLSVPPKKNLWDRIASWWKHYGRSTSVQNSIYTLFVLLITFALICQLCSGTFGDNSYYIPSSTNHEM